MQRVGALGNCRPVLLRYDVPRPTRTPSQALRSAPQIRPPYRTQAIGTVSYNCARTVARLASQFVRAAGILPLICPSCRCAHGMKDADAVHGKADSTHPTGAHLRRAMAFAVADVSQPSARADTHEPCAMACGLAMNVPMIRRDRGCPQPRPVARPRRTSMRHPPTATWMVTVLLLPLNVCEGTQASSGNITMRRGPPCSAM